MMFKTLTLCTKLHVIQWHEQIAKVRRMNKIIYAILFALGYTVSLLPLRVLYLLSDLSYYPFYYLIRYRRNVVRQNLVECFPEKSEAEIIGIERNFYHFLCDYFAETIKLFSMSRREIQRRMTFSGLDKVKEILKTQDVVLYMGHYCNWEWVTSFPLHMQDVDVVSGQIYHRLRNEVSDRLFLHMRSRYDATSIEMHRALRRLVSMKKEKKRFIVGFITDQGPKWWNYVKMWTPFLNHQTSFIVGAEGIAKITDAAVFYLDMQRVKRGHYHGEFILLTEHPKQMPDYEITVAYANTLEASIRRAPQYWLWSHKRWKRTYEEYLQRVKEGLM